MLPLNALKLDTTPFKSGLLTSVTPAYKYVDGHRTETIEGYKYLIAFRSLGFEKINVKIAGDKQLDSPVGTDFPAVELDGITLALYQSNNGTVGLSAKATGIRVRKA